jgi:hypothetical protein
VVDVKSMNQSYIHYLSLAISLWMKCNTNTKLTT